MEVPFTRVEASSRNGLGGGGSAAEVAALLRAERLEPRPASTRAGQMRTARSPALKLMR